MYKQMLIYAAGPGILRARKLASHKEFSGLRTLQRNTQA